MSNPELSPEEKAALEKQRSVQAVKQPYASEMDDRELEHAHREKRPVSETGEAAKPRQ